MNIFLTDQTKLFPKYLKDLCKTAVIAYDRQQLQEKKTTIEINTAKKLEDIDLKFFFEYKIFPDNIMSYMTQWESEKRSMKIGDTIVQQVFIPPLPQFSQKIIFGVRIKEIINEPNRKGYSYETLQGHVEKGISIFTIEKTENGKIIFSIITFSKPALTITKILGPIFSLPYQAYCTRHALLNVKKLIEMENG